MNVEPEMFLSDADKLQQLKAMIFVFFLCEIFDTSPNCLLNNRLPATTKKG